MRYANLGVSIFRDALILLLGFADLALDPTSLLLAFKELTKF
jgi:hypothetical protein